VRRFAVGSQPQGYAAIISTEISLSSPCYLPRRMHCGSVQAFHSSSVIGIACLLALVDGTSLEVKAVRRRFISGQSRFSPGFQSTAGTAGEQPGHHVPAIGAGHPLVFRHGLLLCQQEIDYPAATIMLSRLPAVVKDVMRTATSVLQGVGKDGQAVECALIVDRIG